MSDTLLDSYAESNYSYDADMQQANRQDGQNTVSQTTFGNAKVTSCKFYLKKTGTLSGTLVAKLYTQDGSNLPGTQVGGDSGTVNISSVGTSYGLIEFTWTTNFPTMVSGTNYCLFFSNASITGTDASNYVSDGADNTSPSHAGDYVYNPGTGWSVASGFDQCFYIYGLDIPSTSHFFPFF